MTPPPLACAARRTAQWCDPSAVATALCGEDGLVALLSSPDAEDGRSYVAAAPDWVSVQDAAAPSLFARLREPGLDRHVIGLASYDAGARPATGARPPVWPDLVLARYPALLVFDHGRGRVEARGLGATQAGAERACDLALDWIAQAMLAPRPPAAPGPLSDTSSADAPPAAYVAAVAEVVSRIAAGELFQANVSRGWTGVLRPEAMPFDVFRRLTDDGGATFGAFWRIGDRALVSNSPELFLTWRRATGRVETRPIKGTRPRHADAALDRAEARDLVASAKDRAENLMIVDLMRNDLARVSRPGSVAVDTLFALESHPAVHHLVSSVSARLAPGAGAADLLEATFPPGSITGAPKHQAMKVIAGLEPPRGAWCGSLFLLDSEGDLTASVLIRTAALAMKDKRWTWQARAGAGIVADSDPLAELAETEVKFSRLRRALTG